MRRQFAAGWFLLSASILGLARGDDAPAVAAPIVKRYQVEAKKLQADHAKSVQELREQSANTTAEGKKLFDETVSTAAEAYGTALDKLADKAKSAGDLDGVLNLKKERERVTPAGLTGKAGKLPADAVKARTTFDSAFSKAKSARDVSATKARKDLEAAEKSAISVFTSKAKELHAGYLRELLDAEKAETKNDQLDAAVAVRTIRLQAEKSGPPAPEVGVESSAAGSGFSFRSGEAKANLLKKYGGTEASEEAVASGLAWLAKQQKADGSWIFDGTSKNDTIAATGLALLPFLGAGESAKRGKYQQTIDRGVKYLIANQKADGSFNGSGLTMYTHGIATLALCEAFVMSGDRAVLRRAQSAIDLIVNKQAADGSWGYQPGTSGDTSIIGWQVQAIRAASQTKDIVVPKKCLTGIDKFLDKVASGQTKSIYGYVSPTGQPGTSLSAVGLLSRNVVSNWNRQNEGLVDGVAGLAKRGPTKAPALPDLYYYYYATQVLRIADGREWQDWNEGPEKDGVRSGGMRDWLVSLQEARPGANKGSWAADGAILGSCCGRIGSTALSLLTLEVYYRYVPDSGR